MAACLHPICIRKKEIDETILSSRLITPDNIVKYTRLVPCGHCIECLRTKSKDWRIRLFEEYKHVSDAKFVTLTFSEESYKKLKEDVLNLAVENVDGIKCYCRKCSGMDSYRYIPLEGKFLDGQIARLAIRRFLERYRKVYHVSLRHWLITDYGHHGTERLHLHGIVFNARCSSIRAHRTLINFDKFRSLWSYGHIWLGWCTDRSINYITNYITKIQDSKVFVSPGIGRSFLTEQVVRFYKETLSPWMHTQYMCGKHLLCRYFRNKIFNDDEKERMRLNYENSLVGRTFKNKVYNTYFDMLKAKYNFFGILYVDLLSSMFRFVCPFRLNYNTYC